MEKENQANNMKFELEEDLYEEISIPDVDYEERMQLIKHLDQREKDREELELEATFEQLKNKVSNQDELESLTS